MLNAMKSVPTGRERFLSWKFKLFLLLMLLLFTGVTHAQWESDIRLTNNPAISYTSSNNARCIASSGDSVHVVWYDLRDGNPEIYYKRSTDAGESWGADTRLTNNTFDSYSPSVSVSGSTIHIVWFDHRDGNTEIYYKRSPDGGISWGSDTRLTNNVSGSYYPSVSTSGSAVHVVWDDNRDAPPGNYEIYYKRSPDGGISWGSDIRLTNNSAYSQVSSVSVSSSVVHVVWNEYRDGNWEIYYKRSIDGGINWEADKRLTNNSEVSSLPSISTSGSNVSIVWYDNRDGNDEIYYKRSIDGGISWEADTRLTHNAAESRRPSLSVSGLIVHVVWYDSRDGNPEIYYKRSVDGGISWGADSRLTSNAASSEYPSVSVSGSSVNVVWRDNRDGNYEIYYKRDPTGNPIGIRIISSVLPKEFKLSQNYPNPFNPVTKIRFALLNSSFAKLVVYDALGKEIETLVNEQLNEGTFEADWNAANYSSGIYYYKLIAGNFVQTKKMILIK